MIKCLRDMIEVRRFKRAWLRRERAYRARWLPVVEQTDELVEPVGATEDWSPVAEAEQAGESSDAELELRAAATELEPLLTAFHQAMALAWRNFDAGMLAPMQTTARWHAAGADCCQRCAEHRARTFGAIGERFGIRSFRIDTPTGEYAVLGS